MAKRLYPSKQKIENAVIEVIPQNRIHKTAHNGNGNNGHQEILKPGRLPRNRSTFGERLFEIYSPAERGVYHSPLEIVGYVNPPVSLVTTELYNQQGELLAKRSTQTMGKYHLFVHMHLRFDVGERTDAILVTSMCYESNGITREETRQTPIVLIPGQRSIDLVAPSVGAELSNPIVVSGYSNTHEANVVVEVSRIDGTPIFQQPASGGAFGLYKEFDAELFPAAKGPMPLLIGVYHLDPGYDEPVDQTRIPVTLFPYGLPSTI